MKTIKKAQNGNNVKPDYRNIKKEKRTIKGSKEIVPTAKDSADYREGFENAVKKVRNTRIPKSSNYTRGQREAKERNLKLGGAIKKAQNGVTKEKYPSLKEKVNIAKKLYKDNPSKIFSDAVKNAENNLTDSISKAKKKKMKNGGTVKAKNGKWIQKATASIKRRGTKGVCTGAKFGGPTCKPGSKRYNLAKTFKSIAKKKK